MKTVLVAMLALLLGLFLGGLGPRGDVRKLRDDLSEARAAADRARVGGAAPLALGGLFAAQAAANERAAAARPGRPAPAPSGAGTTPPDAGEEADDADGGRGDGGRRLRGLAALGDKQAFEAARTAATLRAAQFRQAFVEEAHLDGGKQEALDGAIKKMNDEFAAEADKIAATIADKGERMGPRDMADIGVRMLQVYQRADDQFRQGLSPEDVAAAEKAKFDVLTQVDIGSFQKVSDAIARAEQQKGAAGRKP